MSVLPHAGGHRGSRLVIGLRSIESLCSQPKEERLGKVLGDPRYPDRKMRTREENCLSHHHAGSLRQIWKSVVLAMSQESSKLISVIQDSAELFES